MRSTCILLSLMIELSLAQNIVPLPKSMVMSSGSTTINSNSTIYYDNVAYLEVANLLKDEIFKCHGISLSVVSGASVSTGDILLATNSNLVGERYLLTINGTIKLEANGIDGHFPGTVTIVQAIESDGNGSGSALNMTIDDEPFRDFRALMIDVKSYWYSPDKIKQFIKLARYYKIHYLALHTGEKQWIGAVLNQTSNFSVEQRKAHFLYTKAEMDDLILFGKMNGVYLFPHSECTPIFTHMKEALENDFNPNDGYEGYADEMDGQGSFANFDGSENNTRFRSVISEAHRRVIEQFKAGYPSGKNMPVYHIGPVQSEGGMSDDLADYFRGVLMGIDPTIKMGYWAGPSTTSGPLFTNKAQLIPFLYTKQFHPTFSSHLQNGWEIVNAAWSPLYIVGSNIARPVQMVFNEWNYFRAGTDGIAGPIQYDTFSGINDNNLYGGLLSTWSNDANINYAYLRDRLPSFAEHAWNHRPWPYNSSDYTGYQSRISSVSILSDLFVSNGQPASVPTKVAATDGLFSDKVRVTWGASDNGPIEYRLYRNTVNQSNGAVEIAVLNGSSTVYEDLTVVSGTTYFYWVRAFNHFGSSLYSVSNSGYSGDGGGLTLAYESFDYTSGQSISSKNGGTGWSGSWSISAENGSAVINSYGLTYPGLITAGNSVQLSPTTDLPTLKFERNTKGQNGSEGVSTWISFLVRSKKVASGHLAVQFNSAFELGLVKIWGSTLLNTPMLPDTTYFVVYQFECGPGNDIARYWLNPDLAAIPDPSNISTQRLDKDLGTGSKLTIELQGYGQGVYDMDEIRIGTAYSDVMPQIITNVSELPVPKNGDISVHPSLSGFRIGNYNQSFKTAILYNLSGKMVSQSSINEQGYFAVSNYKQMLPGVHILKVVGDSSSNSIRFMHY